MWWTPGTASALDRASVDAGADVDATGCSAASCTLPVSLAVVGGVGTQTSLTAGVATFAIYATGMALPLLAVAVALGNDAAVQRIRGMARYTTQAAGGLLVLAGGYIVYYWASVLAPDDRGPASASGGVRLGRCCRPGPAPGS